MLMKKLCIVACVMASVCGNVSSMDLFDGVYNQQKDKVYYNSTGIDFYMEVTYNTMLNAAQQEGILFPDGKVEPNIIFIPSPARNIDISDRAYATLIGNTPAQTAYNLFGYYMTRGLQNDTAKTLEKCAKLEAMRLHSNTGYIVECIHGMLNVYAQSGSIQKMYGHINGCALKLDRLNKTNQLLSMKPAYQVLSEAAENLFTLCQIEKGLLEQNVSIRLTQANLMQCFKNTQNMNYVGMWLNRNISSIIRPEMLSNSAR